MEQKKMTTCLSNFKKYIQNWDAKIITHDDIEMQRIISDKLKKSQSVINSLLSDSDMKIANGPGDNEQKAKAIISNQNKAWYKELENISKDLLFVEFEMSRLYELKNRKNSEIIKLRAK